MNIIISGNYGAGNLGDECILAGLIKVLNETKKVDQITVLSANPEQTTSAHSVKSVPSFPAGIRSFIKGRAQSTKQALAQSDLFILGGGGLFGGPKFKANIIWASQALRATRKKKRFWCLGQSIGPLKNPIVRLIIKKIFQKAELITVRDLASKQRLAEIGFKEVKLQPDFALYPLPNFQKNESNEIIISLRKNLPHKKQFHQELKKLIVQLQKSRNKKILEIPMSRNQEDTIGLKQYQTANHQEIQQKYQTASLLIGLRLHSIILALKYKLPFLAISYAPKVIDFLTNYDLEDYCVDYQNFTSAKALKVIESFSSAEFQEKIEKAHQKISKDNSKLLSLLCDNL